MENLRSLKQRLIPYGMSTIAFATAAYYASMSNAKGVAVGGILGAYIFGRELYKDRNTIKSFVKQFSSDLINPIKEIFFRRNTDYVGTMI